MDLRVERTYKSLIGAFTELLEASSYENITVAMLCERAMIRRTTFYKHFADKDEFFVFYLKSIRDEFKERVEAVPQQTQLPHYAVMNKELMQFLREHERLAQNAISSPKSGMLFDALAEVVYNDNLAVFKEEARETGSDVDPEMRAAFVCGGILQMIRHWWAAGCPDEGEERMLSVLREV